MIRIMANLKKPKTQKIRRVYVQFSAKESGKTISSTALTVYHAQPEEVKSILTKAIGESAGLSIAKHRGKNKVE